MNKLFQVPLVLCIMLLRFPAAIVGDEGSDYLDSKEVQVEKLVNASIINYIQRCELIGTCSNPTNCSHEACAPLIGDKDGLQCMVVNNNKHCSVLGTSNTSCKNMNLDYRRSYVRVAESTNLETVDTMLSICSQRALDPLMKNFASSNPSVLTRHFIGLMDGTWRVLPGSAQSGDDCRNYDPLVRPWFRTTTSVVKVVVVLIDLGASMNSNLPPNLGVGTILQAAKSIATRLLTTLSAQDHVNIILFDSTRLIQLAPSAVLVQEHNTTDQPELEPLKLELNNQTVESQFRQSNLPAAILAALPNFESNPQAAKVIIAITDGVFATQGNVTLPSANLSESGVKFFIFKLPQANDNDIYLGNNTLVQQLCAIGGHFEPILKNLENPLLALQKFFSYLANLKRIQTGGRPQYGYVYQDAEGIGGNIITVSKAAFSGEDLIGVAGVTIYIESLGNITNQVNQALRSRITGYSSISPQVLLSAANCSLVNKTTQPCEGYTMPYDANGGLCLKTDMMSTIQDLVCCEGCNTPPGQNRSKNPNKLSGKKIAGIAIASIVGFLGLGIVIGLGIWRYRKIKVETAEAEIRMRDFPGDSPVDQIQTKS